MSTATTTQDDAGDKAVGAGTTGPARARRGGPDLLVRALTGAGDRAARTCSTAVPTA